MLTVLRETMLNAKYECVWVYGNFFCIIKKENVDLI